MGAVVLTVQKANLLAMNFYINKLRYSFFLLAMSVTMNYYYMFYVLRNKMTRKLTPLFSLQNLKKVIQLDTLVW